MRPLKIAIPAGKNSFHHIAALTYFGTYHHVVHTENMRAALLRLEENYVDYAVLASRNSIAGNFSETYELVNGFRHVVADEISLPVSLCLAGNSNSNTNRISTVISNKYALAQAEQVLSRLNICERKNVNDTVLAAQLIAAGENETAACICSEAVAKQNGLKIFLRDVQGREENETEFLIISKSGKVSNGEINRTLTPLYISL